MNFKPEKSIAKLLACIYIFTGMVFGGLILSKAAYYIVNKKYLLLKPCTKLKNLIQKRFLKNLELIKANTSYC
jgi:hypothetical protein